MREHDWKWQAGRANRDTDERRIATSPEQPSHGQAYEREEEEDGKGRGEIRSQSNTHTHNTHAHWRLCTPVNNLQRTTKSAGDDSRASVCPGGRRRRATMGGGGRRERRRKIKTSSSSLLFLCSCLNDACRHTNTHGRSHLQAPPLHALSARSNLAAAAATCCVFKLRDQHGTKRAKQRWRWRWRAGRQVGR